MFKREVPEVAQGAVEIKAIEREAGNRSKVAVYSNQSGIDPVGSCVGQKGVRVQAIIAEFNGIEKIDIIQWQENPKNYIGQALSPAKEVRVEVNEEEKLAKVFVAPQELSLAIGKDGQNVRLASKLTGYRIEIEEDPNAPKLEEVAAQVVKEDVKAKEAPNTEPQEVVDEAATKESSAPILDTEQPQDDAQAVESAVSAAAGESEVQTVEDTVDQTPITTASDTVEAPAENDESDKVGSEDEKDSDNKEPK